MTAVTELAVDVGTSAACQALTLPRASYYRDRRKGAVPAVAALRPSPARALRPAEREAVLSRLHEERFQDRSPAAVYATLLDEGAYHCSIRTMYRLLEQRGESRERRDQLLHPPYQKPELMVWFAKTSAETQNEAVLGGVGVNTIIVSIQQEDSGGGEPACAWSAHIYIKDRSKIDPDYAARL
jgi:hypothetical protein